MKKLCNNTIKLIRANWSDPVWSKVISAIIISVGSFILGLLYFGVKSLAQSDTFLNGLESFRDFLTTDTTLVLKNYVIGLFLIFILSVLIPLIRLFRIKKEFVQQEDEVSESIEEPKIEKPKIYDKSTVFFDNRMADAFPGQRGLKWYKNAETAVERLQILLADPLRFHPDSTEMSDPVWWFRGKSNLFIQTCRKLSKIKLLIDAHEYVIDEIAAYRDENYEKSFVYVKVKAEKPIGVYDWIIEDIERNIKEYGYCREEYGLYNDRIAISREEYDDGAAVINGKVTDTKGSKLRVRYLSDYNFIIAAKQSPINSHEFDRGSKPILNGILKGTNTFDELFDLIYPLENPMC